MRFINEYPFHSVRWKWSNYLFLRPILWPMNYVFLNKKICVLFNDLFFWIIKICALKLFLLTNLLRQKDRISQNAPYFITRELFFWIKFFAPYFMIRELCFFELINFAPYLLIREWILINEPHYIVIWVGILTECEEISILIYPKNGI